MFNYMKALSIRFDYTSQRAEQLNQQVQIAYKLLHDELPKHERKNLLRLSDEYNALVDQTHLDGFIAGFCLARGMDVELKQIPPYSFEEEEEQRARGIE